MPDAYPLSWPLGRPRTKRPKSSRFDTTMAAARDGLFDELRRLGARDVVVSTNIRTYNRGGREIPYADQSQASGDPGVAVYYTWKGDQYVFSCDRWDRVSDNVQAIRKTIEALRGIERWGTGDAMRAAFTGFKALPAAGEGTGRGWWDVLGCPMVAGADEIRAAYRRRAKETHPDLPGVGDGAEFRAVQEALHQGLAARATS